MIDQVACFSCGFVFEDRIRKYRELIKKNPDNGKKILTDLGINRYCCRMTVLGSINVGAELAFVNKKS